MKKHSDKRTISKSSPIMVVGFGSIGQRHYRNLKTLGFTNVSVHDTDKEKLASLGNMAVDKISPAILSNFAVVFICNPSHLHVPTALMAAKAGCHMFIEKPLALRVVGIKELERLIAKKKLTTMVACNYRFHPGYEFLAKKVGSPAFGKPLSVLVDIGHDVTKSRPGVDHRKTYAADPKQGGGVIVDSGVHAIDYLSVLFGRVKRVHAASGKISALQIRSEDHAHALVEFRSGVRGTLSLDYFGKPKRHSVEIVCEKGTLRWDFPGNVVEWYDPASGGMHRQRLYEGHGKEVARNDMYLKEVKYFFEVVRGGKPPVSDIRHAREVTETLINMKKNNKA